ncbi:hypothetical protein [Acinetobacter tianfuensis]|uniref:hypothetical protein n=1 Tax=Acinetobacter tianfuensis TaxID=2419603 RepID=UPI0011C45EF5|nr:hypothetical protein [Acinetobacter tianfuensis]
MSISQQRTTALNHINSEIHDLNEIHDTDGKTILQIVRHVEKVTLLIHQLGLINWDECVELGQKLGNARVEAARRGGHPV